MTEKELTREVKKQTERVSSCRAQVYLITLTGTIFVLGLAGVMVVGLILTLLNAGTAVKTAGVIIVIAAALFIVVYYAVKRLKGPLNYTEYTFSDGGTGFIIQHVNKTLYLVQAGDQSFSFEKGLVKNSAVLLKTECLWGFADDTAFQSVEDKTTGRMYTGIRKRGEQTDRTRIQFKDGEPVYGEVNGIRIRYYEVNALRSKSIVLPDELTDAMADAGISFSKNAPVIAKSQLKEESRANEKKR